MKKLLIVVVAVLSVAAIAFGQQVLSRNAVGYQQITLERGKLALIAHSFEELDTRLAVSNVFAAMPTGTKIYFWKEDQSGYLPLVKQAIGGWQAGGSNILYRGRGFWILIPNTAASNAYQAFLMGEVPDRFTAPTSYVNVAAGLTMAAYAYPVETKWTNLAIARQAPTGSKLFTWSGSNYVPYIKSAIGGWGAAGNALVIQPGQGFLLKWASPTNWAEAKPYTWP